MRTPNESPFDFYLFVGNCIGRVLQTSETWGSEILEASQGWTHLPKQKRRSRPMQELTVSLKAHCLAGTQQSVSVI
jgi:hypothetical protein